MTKDQSPQPAETPEPLFDRPTWKQGAKRRQDKANAAEAVAAMAMCDRAFIGFADIADACAKMMDNGSDDAVRRDDFIKRLVTSFRNKEFEYEGRSVVVARANLGLYDDPTMSYDDFRKSLKAAGDDALAMRMLCGDLEIPRRDTLAWFRRHGNPLPVNWFPEAFSESRTANEDVRTESFTNRVRISITEAVTLIARGVQQTASSLLHEAQKAIRIAERDRRPFCHGNALADEPALNAAAELILEEARRGQMTIWGRPGVESHLSNNGNPRQALSQEVLHEAITFNLLHNSVEADAHAASTDYQHASRIQFYDLQVEIAIIENLVCLRDGIEGTTTPPRKSEAHGRGNSPPFRNKTGLKPTVRTRVVAEMTSDYADTREALEREKVELLATRYGASRDTVTKARRAVLDRLDELRHNSAGTPNIDK